MKQIVITELNSESFTIIRQAIADQLKPLERTLGVKLTPGNIKYGEGAFTIKIDGVLVSCGDGKSGQQTEFERNAHMLGLPPEMFGKKIRTSHGVATLRQIVLSNRKYPIIAELEDGRRRVKLSVEYITTRLND